MQNRCKLMQIIIIGKFRTYLYLTTNKVLIKAHSDAQWPAVGPEAVRVLLP